MEHRILNRYPLGNPRRVWRQDNFILSTFRAHTQALRKGLENCAECGFNLLEMGWAPHERAEEALRICEELQVDILFQDFSRFGGMQEYHLDRGPWNNAKAIADHVRNYRHCYGYYIWDEPYKDDQLTESRRVVDLFQKEDPTRLPFTVAIPSYNDIYQWENGLFADYLERYVTVIDPPVLSLDYYPIGLPGYTDEHQLDNSLVWCDLGVMRLLGKKYQMPLWFYYQGMNLHNYAHFEFPMVREQMYAAAMYGCKALQHFTVVDTVITDEGGRGPFFEQQKQIHREFKKLGGTLMALESRYVFHSPDLLPNTPFFKGLADDIAQSEIFAASLPRRLSVGELCDAYGNDYVMVLNRDFTVKQNVSLPLRGNFRIYEVSRETGRQQVLCERTDRLDLTLAEGDAILLRVQKADEDPFTVEYRLEKDYKE